MTKTTVYRHLPLALRYLAMACCLLPFFASCIDEDEMPDTPPAISRPFGTSSTSITVS